MQFRRTAVAVAIAGIAAAAPQIASADTVLSGAIGIQLGGDDANNLVNPGDEFGVGADLDGPKTSDGEIGLDEAVFGVVATHTMDSGLQAYGSVRFDGDGFSGSEVSDDNIYLGVKGGFGDLRIGEVPVAAEYGQLANDIFDQTDSVNQGIGYTGNFGPATIGVSYSPSRNEDVIGVGARFNVGGFRVGIGGEDRDDLTNYSVGASFGFAGASVAVHFVGQEVAGGGDDTGITGFNVGYGIAGASVALTIMNRDPDAAEDQTAVRLDVGYGLGGGLNLSARYTWTEDEATIIRFDENGVRTDTENGDDLGEWRVLLSKTF